MSSRLPEQPDLALPIFAGAEAGAYYRITTLYGTGIPLGGGLVLTANHVAVNATGAGPIVLVGHDLARRGPYPTTPATSFHSWPDYDLAVLNAPALRTKPLDWTPALLPQMGEVRSLGYAFGLDQRDLSLTVRAFVGSVVSRRPFPPLPACPEVYELDFAAPRGLSGAALFLPHGPWVSGIIVGNFRTEMLVFSDRESVDESGRQTIVERYEALNLGIAITAETVLRLPLPTGQTVRDHVVAHGAGILS